MSALPSYSYLSKTVRRGTKDGRSLFFAAGEEGLKVLEYLLALHAPLFGFGLVQCVVMPDEVFLSLNDYGGNRSKFQGTVFSLWVRIMNKLVGRSGSMIEAEPTDCAHLLDAEGEMDDLMETALTPVRRGFVHNSRLWPGTLFTPEDAGVEREIERPACMSAHYDERVRYTVEAPQHQETSASAMRDTFRNRRRREERAIQGRFKSAARGFVGAEAAFDLDPNLVPEPRPKKERELFRAGDPDLLDAALTEYAAFRKHYRACLQALRDGVVDIVWPPGTNFHHFVNGFERMSGALRLVLMAVHPLPD